MAFDCSAFIDKNARTGRPILQLTHIVNLGNVTVRGKHGGDWAVRKVLLVWYRETRNGDIRSVCGVTDFRFNLKKDGSNRTLRTVLDAADVSLPTNLQDGHITDPKAMIEAIATHLRDNRPGMKMEFSFGRGHISVSKAEPAKPYKDVGANIGLPPLGEAILERYKSRAVGAERRTDESTEEWADNAIEEERSSNGEFPDTGDTE